MQLKHYIYIAAFGLTFLSVSGNVSYALDVEETRLNLHLLQMEQMKLEKNQKESTLKLQAEENQLKDLQKKLVAQAAKTKQTEQALIEKEQALEQIIDETKLLSSVLNEEQQNYANMLLALQRVERTPMTGLIAQPGQVIETARTQTILSALIPQIQQKSVEISNLVSQHQAIKAIYLEEKQTLEKEQEKHLEQEKQLNALLAERKDYFSKYQTSNSKLNSKALEISKKVNSLKSLIEEIDETEISFAKLLNIPKKPDIPKYSADEDERFFAQANGKTSVLPVAGVILTGFNKKNDVGMTNKGLDIQTRPGATVITPLSGRVKFAGPFKSYKNIVIIEHSNKKISLLGGLDDINVSLGQDLRAGEPVGKMSKQENKNTLYFELRDKGQQIDPEKYLWALAKKQQRT